MKPIKLASITLLLIGSMMSTAFAEPSSCDYYRNKILTLENSKKYTATDRKNVAALFRSIAKACTAKGAIKVAKLYNDSATHCEKNVFCETYYKAFMFQNGPFKGTISTKTWCGYIGSRAGTAKPQASEVYKDLEEAYKNCVDNHGLAYRKVLFIALYGSCMTIVDGKKVVDPNPKKPCTDITEKLYQLEPNW